MSRPTSKRELEKRARALKKAAALNSLFMRRSLGMYHSPEKRFGVKCSFTAEEFRAYIKQDIGKPCRYCKRTVTTKTFSIDHEIPVSRGGELCLANLAVVCMGCNKAKGELTGVEFRALMEFLGTFEEKARVDVYGRLKAGGAIKGRWSKHK